MKKVAHPSQKVSVLDGQPLSIQALRYRRSGIQTAGLGVGRISPCAPKIAQATRQNANASQEQLLGEDCPCQRFLDEQPSGLKGSGAPPFSNCFFRLRSLQTVKRGQLFPNAATVLLGVE